MKWKVDEKLRPTLIKRMFWLAWQACGSPFGLGVLQDQPGATEESVWKNVSSAGDYPPCSGLINIAVPEGRVFADYVFGRMVKLWVGWEIGKVILPDHEVRPAYQIWCRVHPSYEALLQAAVDQLIIIVEKEKLDEAKV